MNDGLAEKKKMVFLGLLFYSSPQLVILGNEYDNMFSESVNLSVLILPCFFYISELHQASISKSG